MAIKKIFVGVDPGSKGAIALLDPTTMQVAFIDLSLTMPQVMAEIRAYEDSQPEGTAYSAMIEDVASLPNVSAKSNFSFGYNLGSVTTLLMAMALPLDKVRPKAWQSYVGIKPKSPTIKKDVAEIVTRLYPTCDIYGPRGGLIDGRSDALAIAHYHFKTSQV